MTGARKTVSGVISKQEAKTVDEDIGSKTIKKPAGRWCRTCLIVSLVLMAFLGMCIYVPNIVSIHEEKDKGESRNALRDLKLHEEVYRVIFGKYASSLEEMIEPGDEQEKKIRNAIDMRIRELTEKCLEEGRSGDCRLQDMFEDEDIRQLKSSLQYVQEWELSKDLFSNPGVTFEFLGVSETGFSLCVRHVKEMGWKYCTGG